MEPAEALLEEKVLKRMTYSAQLVEWLGVIMNIDFWIASQITLQGTSAAAEQYSG